MARSSVKISGHTPEYEKRTAEPAGEIKCQRLRGFLNCFFLINKLPAHCIFIPVDP